MANPVAPPLIPQPFRMNTTMADDEIPIAHLTLAKEIFDSLPYFNAEGKNAVKDFDKFEGIVRGWLGSIPRENQSHFMHRIAQRLYGRARQMLEGVDLYTVEDILNRLSKKIKKGDPFIVWTRELHNATPRDGATIEDFHYHLKSILEKIERNAPLADKEAVMRSIEKTAAAIFHEHLPDYARCLCS